MKILIIVSIIIVAIMILNVIRFKSLTKKWKLHPNKKWYMVNGTNGIMISRNGNYPLSSTLIKSEENITMSFLVGKIAKKMNDNIDFVTVALSGESLFNSVTFGVPMINGELVFEEENFDKFNLFIKENLDYSPNKGFNVEISSRWEALNIKVCFTSKGYPIG